MSGSILLKGPDGHTYTASPYYHFGYFVSKFSPFSVSDSSEWWDSQGFKQWGYPVIFENLEDFTILARLPDGWKSKDDFLV